MTSPRPGQHRFHAALPVNPDEPIANVTPGGDPSDAVATGLRFRHVYGAMLLHRDHDLYVAEADHGRHLQHLIRDRLLAERFSLDHADEWALRNWRKWLSPVGKTYSDHDDPRLCDKVVDAALEYRETGMPIDEAFAWVTRSISATYAVHSRSHGWNPEAFSTLIRLCIEAVADNEDEWVEAPIVWWRALRYLQAGLHLPEALEQERRRLDGEDIDPAIDLLLALTARD